ncbi:MAG: BMP family ABC transporter substrate-binding protein [Anaerolineales bacterium]|nr:BMP family ABC transporter substrate-binding protein [Anaerolineales bacterium]
MRKKSLLFVISLMLIAAFVFTACQPAPAEEAPVAEEAEAEEVMEEAEAEEAEEAPAAEEGGLQIPEIEEGKFNVAFVMLSTHDDGGWSQAQYDGMNYLLENVEGVHAAYMESVAEGADSEQVFRALSRKGFDLIFGGSFGYMDSMEVVAEEFPEIGYVHISGYKSNMTNFGNMFGEMEVMKYLTGMLAGSRAKADGKTQVGGMATFPIPEELRLFNAYALGVQETCPECTVDIRWIYTWHDPIIEREGADSLFDAGSHVVMTGADTPASALAAADREGVYGVTYDWSGSCTIDECLTAPYWIWGPVFSEITEGAMNGTYEYGWHYFDTSTGGIGLYGFMDGEEVQPGVASLPAEDLQLVRDTLAAALAGEFTRFDVFEGPITDNQGNLIIPEGARMQQADIDQFAPGAPGLECEYGMYWWNENIAAELPEL